MVMTPTEVCEGFNMLYKLTDKELLAFRQEALFQWGKRGDATGELIAMQAEYVCRRRFKGWN